jgi:hypothetical protein
VFSDRINWKFPKITDQKIGRNAHAGRFLPLRKSAVGLLALFCFLIGFHGRCQAHANIALNKPYTYSNSPNYALCTDPGDATQLTDGVYTAGYFWTQMTTVGWQKTEPVIITLNLGSIQPVAGLSYNTASRTNAGVYWPLSVFVFLSDDGVNYYYLGDLTDLTVSDPPPANTSCQIHKYWTDQLRTHAKYVKLAIFPSGSGSYVFVDEIEVYQGDSRFLNEPFPGGPITDINAFIGTLTVTHKVKQRLSGDLNAVRNYILSQFGQSRLADELTSMEPGIDGIQIPSIENFNTTFPMNPLHEGIFSIQGQAWSKAGIAPVKIWRKNRWDMLSPTETPQNASAAIDVSMMNNEFRSAAFNISNAGGSPIELKLQAAGLPGGTAPDYITFHKVLFTDTKYGTAVAAALPAITKELSGNLFEDDVVDINDLLVLADQWLSLCDTGNSYCGGADLDGSGRVGLGDLAGLAENWQQSWYYPVKIPAGMTQQIWLTFNPKDMPAGDYDGQIAIEPYGLNVPVHLKLYPFHFPDQPALHSGGWDYTNSNTIWSLTSENVNKLVSLLKLYFVESPWGTNQTLPAGTYDSSGNMINAPSTANFETWLQRWPGARKYCVFMSVGSSFGGLSMSTPAFENAVTNWINWWVSRLDQWNISADQLCLLLVDEPATADEDARIIRYGDIIHQAQPDVVIWEDPTWANPASANPQMFAVSDVLSPNLKQWIDSNVSFRDFYLNQQQNGKELWFYSCEGPAKLLDPYSYHRMQAWFCYQYGAKGSCFWSYADARGVSSWNEYLATANGGFTPLFIDSVSVTTGKHLEAIREGIEDYEYLKMLKDRVDELVGQGRSDAVITEAQALLTEVVDSVTACMTDSGQQSWLVQKDRTVADMKRIEILDMLVQLKDL